MSLLQLLRRLRHDALASVAAVVLLFTLGVAVIGPHFVRSAGTRVRLSDRFLPPIWGGGGWDHIFGTDALGRDVAARLILGARVSLLVGFGVVIIAGTIGTLLGLLAGYKGGWVDTALMRLVDAQLAFPGLVLIIAVVGALGPSTRVMIIVLSAYAWMIFARLSRGIAVQLKAGGYVRAAQLIGCSGWRIITRHLLPAVAGPILTQSMLELGRIMLAEASLSFLGLGVQPPDVSWGLMVAENRPYISTAWWTVTLPGFALATCVLMNNVLAGWIRVQMDPMQRQVASARRLRRRPGRAVTAPELAEVSS